MLPIVRQSASLAPLGSGLVRYFGASAVQLKRRDPALPQPPKGSASPYALFVKEWFPANKADHTKDGKIDLPTVSSAMSAAWSALTGTDKQSYNDRAKELKKAYDAEYRKWYNALEPEEIKAIEKDTGKKISPPGGKRGKKQEDRDRPGNPGTPITAFFEYLKELREGPEGQGVSVAEVAKKGGESWRQMSEDDKKKYRDIAAEKKARYVEWQKSL